MGVWIETVNRNVTYQDNQSHTLYGCVDWNFNASVIIFIRKESHPVWVCGLKLWELGKALKAAAVTPCMGVWIETREM